MQASSKFSIAIHICIYLDHTTDELTTSQTLAESVNTNPVVIRRLLPLLKARKIVNSVAGANGGFYLARDAQEISLWEIYLAVRDEQFFNKPKEHFDSPISLHLGTLVDHVFEEAEYSMETVFGLVSVRQLTQKLQGIIGKNDAVLTV